MIFFFILLFALAVGAAIFLLLKNKQLEEEAIRTSLAADQRVAAREQELNASFAESQRQANVQFAQKVSAIQQDAQRSVAEAQKLIDQQFTEFQQEAVRVKRHYEAASRKVREEAEALVAKLKDELEPLRKYQGLKDAEAEAQRRLAEALKEGESLRAEARYLLEQARSAAGAERAIALQRARDIREEAEALLAQATRDAGRIMADADKRAEKIGGDAYIALRDKQTLEQAVQSLWNVTEGYGDRYVIPSHSILDELAVEFGYDSAGAALKSAREQSRRMVEEKLAAACNYDEPDRRDRANRFVIDAFNGRVDAILTQVRRDDYGTLQQKIRDAYALVNLNGLAFRDARILPAYLDSRLAELKWAATVYELARKQKEEQRYLKERLRDEEKARRENEEKLRQAAKEEELKRRAVEEAEQRFAEASAEQKAQYEAELEKVREELVQATQRALTIAQLTKKGHVYIISNVGSFGDGVYKIGQTRRPDPEDRVDELGDASVPFDFDIHALIESDNAPALEHKIHKKFLARQVNKMNFRKEFFHVSLTEIRQEIDTLKQGEDFIVKGWTEKAIATQYRESLEIDKDPQKKAAWLAKQKTLAEREIRREVQKTPVAVLPEVNVDDQEL